MGDEVDVRGEVATAGPMQALGNTEETEEQVVGPGARLNKRWVAGAGGQHARESRRVGRL